MTSTQKILASIAAGGFAYAYYMGTFRDIQMKDTTLRRQLFVYKDHLGNYKNKDIFLSQVRDDFKELPPNSYTVASVFYDNPLYIKDKNNERSVIGVMADVSQRAAVQQFLMKHPEYHVVETDSMDTVSTQFPYRNMVSFRLMRLKGLYNKLCRFSTEKKDVKSENRFVVERYPFLTGGEKTVDVMIPYGPNSNQLSLSSLLTPTKKDKLHHAYFTP